MATAIGKHVDRITQSVFGARGFAYAQILTNWDAIVGADLAEYCQPERLRWPRGQERIKDKRRRLGGTLTIKVQGAAAIELQHQTPRIIEQINTFHGYQAVAAVKIVQGHLDRKSSNAKSGKVPALTREQELELRLRLETVKDEELRQALLRLGRGALARKTRTTNPKM